MKGKTNNPNGRPKGSTNKTTATLRQWINDFIECNKETLQSDFDCLEPKERIILFEKLLKYALPTLQATSLETTEHQMPIIQFIRQEGNEDIEID